MKNSEKEKKEYQKLLCLLPLIIAVAVIPFLSRLHGENPEISGFEWSGGGMYQKDIFLYWKAVSLNLLLPVLCIMLVANWPKDRKWKGEGRGWSMGIRLFLFLAVYELWMLLSSVFSEYRDICFHGAWAVYESLYVILCYGLLAFYGFVVLDTEKKMRVVLYAVAAGAGLMAVIAIFQMFGLDFFRSHLGYFLTAGDTSWENWQKTVYWYEKGRVQGTLANPNNFGHYAAMVIPVCTGLAFSISKKGKKAFALKIFFGCCALFMLCAMCAAVSKSGMAALLGTSVLAVILFRKKLFRKGIAKWKVIMTIGLLGGFVVLAFVVKKDALVNNLKKAAKEFVNKAPVDSFYGAETTKDGLLVYCKGAVFQIRIKDTEQLCIMKEDGTPYPGTEYQGVHFSIQKEEEPVIYITDESGKNWRFNSEYRYLSPLLGAVKCHFSEDVLRGREALATSRGYIWGRSIPLLKSRLLLGTGADSFLFYFPQDDYIARERFGYGDLLITKPHNMYLQAGIHAGIPGLAAYLAFFLGYAVWSFRIYFKESFCREAAVMGASVFLGITSYLIAGLSMDSQVGVSPVAYVLLGVGFAANTIVENTKYKEERL